MMKMNVTRRLCRLSGLLTNGGFHRTLSTLPSSVPDSFKFSDLEIELTKNPRAKPNPENLVFGKEFSDHMFEVDWSAESGWGKPSIKPLQNLSIHPAAKVLHYALELFEGMKGYKCVDDKVRLFRPDRNMDRMRRTANRCTFPDFDANEMTKCIQKLVSIDREWIPESTKCSLYIRPTFIGTEGSLGVSTSMQNKIYVITGPVGPYYPTGFQPVTLLADPQYVRAAPGGCGKYKMGSNYGPTIYVQKEAVTKHKAQQVLWLHGPDHNVTEVGTMNMFMFWKNENGEKELITPPLESGLILPGVTRLSLLELAREWDEFKVSERDFTMKDVTKALKEKRLYEMFGAGTACVVCPIDNIIYQEDELHIPTMTQESPLWQRFWNQLTDIQYGRIPSKWMLDVD